MHFPKPWFRKSRDAWYVEFNGKQIKLGRDKELAFEQYRKLLAAPPETQQVIDSSLVVVLCDNFLGWVEKHRSAATYGWYRDRLQRFASEYPTLTISELKPFHVQQWVDEMDIAPTTQRNYIRSIKRAMKWSRQQGYIKTNPIAEMEAPSADRREETISKEVFEQILAVVPDETFCELLIVSYDTGCRPQEARRVESRHFDAKNRMWVFPKSESKMRKKARVVYLTERASEICERLAAKHPSGALFRNSKNVPWSNYAIQCAVRRVRVRLGKLRMKEQGLVISNDEVADKVKTLRTTKTVKGKIVQKTAADLRCEAKRKLTESLAARIAPVVCLYTLRHSFATRALLEGVDSLTVSQLLGHSDVNMLAKVYALYWSSKHERRHFEYETTAENSDFRRWIETRFSIEMIFNNSVLRIG